MSNNQPLLLPDDEALLLPRRLAPYGNRSDEPLDRAGGTLSTEQFLERLARGAKWYAILSAEGSGKTTLLNEAAYRLDQAEIDLLVIPPMNLEALYNDTKNLDKLLQRIVNIVHDELTEKRDIALPTGAELKNPRAEFVTRLKEIAAALRDGYESRLLLLIDGFQNLPQADAHDFATLLMNLYDESHRWIACVLTADNDLETRRQDYSPLLGRVETYTLLDFDERGVDLLLERAQAQGKPRLDADGLAAFWRLTRGYPALCWDVLNCLTNQAQPCNERAVEQAVEGLIHADGLPWLKRTFDELYKQADSDLLYESVLDKLLLFLNGEKLHSSTREAVILELKGLILRQWDGMVDWRNPTVQKYVHFYQAELRKKISRRKDQRELPGRKLRALGTVHVSLVMNFRHFAVQDEQKDDKEVFDHLRGSQPFEKALETLKEDCCRKGMHGYFGLDSKQDDLREIATDLNIFRQEAARVAFAPIYRLQLAADTFTCQPSPTLRKRLFPEKSSIPEDEQLKCQTIFINLMRDEWKRWQRKSIQFTRDGLLHVRLEQDFEENQGELLTVLESVLSLERRPEAKKGLPPIAEEVSLQWEMAMALAGMFIKEAFQRGDDGYYRLPGDELSDLRFTPGGIPGKTNVADDPVYPLNERYVTYEFTKLCNCPPGIGDEEEPHLIRWKDLFNLDDPGKVSQAQANYITELAGLLEGAAVTGPGDQPDRFPEIKQREAQKHLETEQSTWDGELCLLTQSNGIIYHLNYMPGEKRQPPPTREGEQYVCPRCKKVLRAQFSGVVFSQHGQVSYQDYWRCIQRGLEYILNLRLLARLVASVSTDHLTTLADLAEREGTDQGSHRDELRKLRKNLATNTRLLAHLRDVTIPIFIARTDYATSKFEHFIDLCRIKETINNAESDFQEIDSFLKHEDEKVSQQRDTNLATLFSMAALILSAIALPSLYVDFENSTFGQLLAGGKVGTESPAKFAYILHIVQFLLIVTFVVFIIRTYRQARELNGDASSGGSGKPGGKKTIRDLWEEKIMSRLRRIFRSNRPPGISGPPPSLTFADEPRTPGWNNPSIGQPPYTIHPDDADQDASKQRKRK